jgi:hypothetical protein
VCAIWSLRRRRLLDFRTSAAGINILDAAISFMCDLQLTVLGILGEYLGAVFDEVKQPPLYVIDGVFGCVDC